jgi:hypothetical protein
LWITQNNPKASCTTVIAENSINCIRGDASGLHFPSTPPAMVPGCKLKAFHLLGRYSTVSAIPPALVLHFFFFFLIFYLHILAVQKGFVVIFPYIHTIHRIRFPPSPFHSSSCSPSPFLKQFQ